MGLYAGIFIKFLPEFLGLKGNTMSDNSANQPTPIKPVILCILDGWGHREEQNNNAVALAKTPHMDRYLATCPHGLVNASESFVGLPDGQIGNSEVGHLNLGAGRVVMADLPRINHAIASGQLTENDTLQDFIAKMKQSGGTAHLMGLLSKGGVHSHQDHIAALAKILDNAKIPVVIHAFLDGRDVPPRSALESAAEFITQITALQHVRIGVVSGRYYAMDRDQRWERIEPAYNALVNADAPVKADPITAIQDSYEQDDKGDEFVLPVITDGYTGMQDGDGVLFGNFRADRARQILDALLNPGFEGFHRSRVVPFTAAAGLVEYSSRHNDWLGVLFPPEDIVNSLGDVVSQAGLKQFRTAETEKYAHVTFFFNGGREEAFTGEDRSLIPSPKVATYDLQPEMSAADVTDAVIGAVTSGDYALIVVNFANTDMVGHSGVLDAAIKAVETVDDCLGRIETALLDAGGTMLITADHGNAEQMHDALKDSPHTAHTLNLVPAILVSGPQAVEKIGPGEEGAARLADIAPTILDLMGLQQPAEMTGQSLLQMTKGAGRRNLDAAE